jgi:alpha-tubulin suppressor-like RCC1 family protein
VYTAGRNDSGGGGGHGSPPFSDAGQLGRSGAMGIFGKVDFIGDDGNEIVAKQVACGRYHTVVLTNDGSVYTFGLNDYGQLGRLALFGDPDVKKACGCDSGNNCACSEGSEDETVRIARFPIPGTLFYLSAGDCSDRLP